MSLELPTANSSEPASSQRNAGEAGSERRKAVVPRLAAVLLHEPQDDEHAEQARDHRHGEDPAQRHVGLRRAQGDQRTEHGAHGVHGAVQAERQALLPRPVAAAMRLSRDAVRMPLPKRSTKRAGQRHRPDEGEREISLPTRPGRSRRARRAGGGRCSRRPARRDTW